MPRRRRDNVSRKKGTAEQSTVDFYDTLARDYDRMTEFQKRFITERPYFRLLVERFNIRSGLDAGCGTGFHSFLLSQLGVSMTGTDISGAMLQMAGRHALHLNMDVPFLQIPFHRLPKELHQDFDAVFCLGNSLAHLLSREELADALRGFRSVLNPGGLLILQMLNYDRILASKEPVQSVKESEETIFVRFYEYGDTLIRFNLLRIERRNGALTHALESVPLRPYSKEELLHACSTAGFRKVELYGSIAMTPYDAATSRDIVLLSRVK